MENVTGALGSIEPLNGAASWSRARVGVERVDGAAAPERQQFARGRAIQGDDRVAGAQAADGHRRRDARKRPVRERTTGRCRSRRRSLGRRGSTGRREPPGSQQGHRQSGRRDRTMGSGLAEAPEVENGHGTPSIGMARPRTGAIGLPVRIGALRHADRKQRFVVAADRIGIALSLAAQRCERRPRGAALPGGLVWRGGWVPRTIELALVRVLEGVPQCVHRGGEVSEFLEVLLAERLELARALFGETQAHDAEVVAVLAARDQSRPSRRGRRARPRCGGAA